MGLPARLLNQWFESHFITECRDDGGFRCRLEGDLPIPFAMSQGLFLWCPCGFGAIDKDGNERFPVDLSIGSGRPHGLLIPFSNPPNGVAVPVDFGPLGRDGKTHPRWTVGGTGLSDLTLSPSVDVGTSSCWHGFIKSGEIT